MKSEKLITPTVKCHAAFSVKMLTVTQTKGLGLEKVFHASNLKKGLEHLIKKYSYPEEE